jgi:histone H3/H4
MERKTSINQSEQRLDQDQHLPVTNISKIMKKVLPTNAKVTKEAKEAIQQYVSELVCLVTSEAADRCTQEKRKTINGEDILWSFNVLGYENYNNCLKIYLSKYRQALRNEKFDKQVKRIESASNEYNANSSSKESFEHSKINATDESYGDEYDCFDEVFIQKESRSDSHRSNHSNMSYRSELHMENLSHDLFDETNT